MGDETRVRFLEDKWCDEAPLCETFLSLYIMTTSKGVFDGGGGVGSFIRGDGMESTFYKR